MKRIACVRWNDACTLLADSKERVAGVKRRIAQRCGRFSPLVGWDATDGDSLLLDIGGVAHLFGGEPSLCNAVAADLASSFGRSVRGAVADTLGAAWAGARYGFHGPLESGSAAFLIIAPGKTAAFLERLPVEALRLSAETVRVLHELGLQSVGQLEALPREGFLSRFGPLLLRRLDQAFGRLDEPVPASPSPRQFAARWSDDDPIANREMIEAVLQRLVEQLAAQLADSGQGALRLECRLDFELAATVSRAVDERGGRRRTISVGLFQPSNVSAHLFELVLLQLDRLRIASPVRAIEVAATLTAPRERPRQTTLFDLGRVGPAGGACGEKPEQRSRHWTMLVERLGSRLGADAVLGVRLCPEAQPELAWHVDPLVGNRRRRAARKNGERARGQSERDEPGKLPPRPLRLLPRPRLLDCGGGASVLFDVGETPAPRLSPRRFRLGGRELRIARHWGPERIETGWWRGRPIGRDYFRVETTDGCRYWLFRRLRDGQWFLYGVFD